MSPSLFFDLSLLFFFWYFFSFFHLIYGFGTKKSWKFPFWAANFFHPFATKTMKNPNNERLDAFESTKNYGGHKTTGAYNWGEVVTLLYPNSHVMLELTTTANINHIFSPHCPVGTAEDSGSGKGPGSRVANDKRCHFFWGMMIISQLGFGCHPLGLEGVWGDRVTVYFRHDSSDSKSILVHFAPFWSIWVHFGPFWSIFKFWKLTPRHEGNFHFEPFWSILVHFPILETNPTSRGKSSFWA